MGKTIPKSGEVLTSFNTRSLTGLCPPCARHQARLWENKPVMVLALKELTVEGEDIIHSFMNSLRHHLLSTHLMPGTSLDTENPAENRTVGNCSQATLVACFSRMASRCIQSAVVTVTLSP